MLTLYIPFHPQPQDPPTLDDVAAARIYTRAIDVSYQVATREDLGRAVVYESRVASTHGQAVQAPAWFGPALAAGLANLTRTVNVTYNLQCGDGGCSIC